LVKSNTDDKEETIIASKKSLFVRGFFRKINGVKNLAIGIIAKIIPICAGVKKDEKYLGKKIT
jgi:hypothetical protein